MTDDIETLRNLKDKRTQALKDTWGARSKEGHSHSRALLRVLCAEIRALREAVMCLSLRKQHAQILNTLDFYADPETYFAIAFIPDPPSGEFMDDFSDTSYLGRKPGKMAREALDAVWDMYEGRT